MTRQVVLCRWHFFVSLPVSLVDGNEWRSVRLMSPRWMLRPAKMFAWKSYGNFEDSCLEHSIGDRTTKFRDYLGIKQQIAMNHNFFFCVSCSIPFLGNSDEKLFMLNQRRRVVERWNDNLCPTKRRRHECLSGWYNWTFIEHSYSTDTQLKK